jgi:hypothetical protein
MQQCRRNHYRYCLLSIDREILQVNNTRRRAKVIRSLVLGVSCPEKLGLVDGSKDWPVIDSHLDFRWEGREFEEFHVLDALDICKGAKPCSSCSRHG